MAQFLFKIFKICYIFKNNTNYIACVGIDKENSVKKFMKVIPIDQKAEFHLRLRFW